MMRSAVRGVARVSAARYAAPASVFARNMSSDTSGLVRTSRFKSEVQPGFAARAASGAHFGGSALLAAQLFAGAKGTFLGDTRAHTCMFCGKSACGT